MATFLRFQTPGRDGLFGVAWDLVDQGDLPERDLRRVPRALERHGVVIEFQRTRNPGFVTYEDRYQVVAIPFRDR